VFLTNDGEVAEDEAMINAGQAALAVEVALLVFAELAGEDVLEDSLVEVTLLFDEESVLLDDKLLACLAL
jgi:hypothetical protein